jgi:hypothetical protein
MLTGRRRVRAPSITEMGRLDTRGSGRMDYLMGEGSLFGIMVRKFPPNMKKVSIPDFYYDYWQYIQLSFFKLLLSFFLYLAQVFQLL